MGDESLTLLLDTHVWVWAAESPERLGRKTRQALGNLRMLRTVCSVSTLEAARLAARGTIQLTLPVAEWVERSLRDLKAFSVPVDDSIAIEAYHLPEPFHRDPADRQIVACARVHGFVLVTADRRILDWKHVRSMDAGE